MDKKSETFDALTDVLLTKLSKDPQLAAKQQRLLDILKAGNPQPTPEDAAPDAPPPENLHGGHSQ